ncbi:MAG: endonuclease III [Nitrospiraceae bacterium]|nr:MAG: endonuclease III [Nitrospiraceae bacterium]
MNNRVIHNVIPILRKQVQSLDVPWLENMVRQDRINRDPFRVLISCILSLRTQDKTTGEASERLFKLAPDIQSLSRLTIAKIERAIYPVGFYKVKAGRLRELCRVIMTDYDSRVPDELDELLKLKGVGRKTANLVITLGYGKPGICVDTHVHRITNRWGYVETKTPEQTEFALRAKLPAEYWLEINGLLVAFGQGICRPISPICSRCNISRFCSREGVARHR